MLRVVVIGVGRGAEGGQQAELHAVAPVVEGAESQEVIGGILRGLPLILAAGVGALLEGVTHREEHRAEGVDETVDIGRAPLLDVTGSGLLEGRACASQVVGETHRIELEHVVPSDRRRVADGLDDRRAGRGVHRADLVVEVQDEVTALPCEPGTGVATEAPLVVPGDAGLEVVRDEDVGRVGDRLAEGDRLVGLGGVAVGGDPVVELVLGTESRERDEGVVALVGEGRAGLGLGDVHTLVDRLPDVLEADCGDELELAEDEAVLREERGVPVLPPTLVGEGAGRCPRLGARLLGEWGLRVIEHRPAGDRVGVAEPVVVVAQLGKQAEGVELLVLDLVTLRFGPRRDRSEAAAVLTLAPAPVVVPPSAEAEEGAVAQVVLVDQRGGVAGDVEIVVEAGCAGRIGVPVDCVGAGRLGESARLLVVVLVGVDNQVGALRRLRPPGERAAPVVDRPGAVGLAESVGLAVVVVAVVAELVDGSAQLGEVGEVVEASDRVERAEPERGVERRFLHDVVHRAARLRPVEEGGSSSDDLKTLHPVDRGGVVGFRVSEHVGMDRDPVLHHLHELHAVRGKSARADAHERRRLLGENDSGRGLKGLAVVVVVDLR